MGYEAWGVTREGWCADFCTVGLVFEVGSAVLSKWGYIFKTPIFPYLSSTWLIALR